jgi:hypothetical protein
VIDTIFRTPAREKLYGFTAPYVDIEVPVFFNRELSGFTVGVKAGDACIEVRPINCFSLDIVITPCKSNKIRFHFV